MAFRSGSEATSGKVLNTGEPAATFEAIVVMEGAVTIDDPRILTWEQLRELALEYLNDFPRCVAEAQPHKSGHACHHHLHLGHHGRPKGGAHPRQLDLRRSWLGRQ